MRRTPLYLVLAAALAVVALTVRAPTRTGLANVALLPRPEMVKALFRPQLPLVVDAYWLRMINYAIGVKTGEEGRLLLAFGRFIEALDPRFSQIYWFTAVNAVTRNGNVWENAEEVAQNLEQGFARFPDDLKIIFVLSFTYMEYQKDFVNAARVLRQGAKVPGAPPHFNALATRLLAAAGKFDESRSFAMELEETAPDEETRNFFRDRRLMVDLEEILRGVDLAIGAFRGKTGRYPTNVAELYSSGELTDLPRDPFGGAIEIDENHKSYSTARRERLVVHQ